MHELTLVLVQGSVYSTDAWIVPFGQLSIVVYISSNVVTYDVESILNNKSRAEGDEFDILEEDNETLEEYVEEDVIESNEDDDINDGADIQDISSGNE